MKTLWILYCLSGATDWVPAASFTTQEQCAAEVRENSSRCTCSTEFPVEVELKFGE